MPDAPRMHFVMFSCSRTSARPEMSVYTTSQPLSSPPSRMPARRRPRARFLPSKSGRESTITTLKVLPSSRAAWKSVRSTRLDLPYTRIVSPVFSMREEAWVDITSPASVTFSRMKSSIVLQRNFFASDSSMSGSSWEMSCLSHLMALPWAIDNGRAAERNEI